MQIKPTITVTLDGPAGSGKSTLALYLANLLEGQPNCCVRLRDEGCLQPIVDPYFELPKNFSPIIEITVAQK
jgi:deoxyadenosine/deoxycytidine kinase